MTSTRRPRFPAQPSRRKVMTGLCAGTLASLVLRATTPGAFADTPTGPILARPIPRSGELLPLVGLGTAGVFDVGDDAAALERLSRVVQTLIAGGGKVIDTAPSYGSAERVLGAIFATTGLRPKAFVATKLESFDPPEASRELEASRKRLRTDTIDLLQFHKVGDPKQSLALLRDWKARGFCRYNGVTTSYGGAFPAIEAVLGREKPDFVQINYSLVDRRAERRLLPLAAEVGAAVLVNLPLGRGRVFRAVGGHALPPWAAAFDAKSWGQFFLKYILSNHAVTAVIPGTANPAHMADNLAAGRGRLPDAAERKRMVAFIENL